MAQLGDTIIKGDLTVLGGFKDPNGIDYLKTSNNKWGLAQGTVNIQYIANIASDPRYFKLMEFTMNQMGNQDLQLIFAYEHCREVQNTNKTFKLLSLCIRSNGSGSSCVPANPAFRIISEDISKFGNGKILATYKNNSGVITISLYLYLAYSYSFTRLRLLDMNTRTNVLPTYNTFDYITSDYTSKGISSIPTDETNIPLTNETPTIYSGTTEPEDTLGKDGDIYILLES